MSNDILSLNVLLSNLVKNPLVAHAAIYSVDDRILAEAGSRPTQSMLGETEGLYLHPHHLPGGDRRAVAHQPGHAASSSNR